MIPTKNWRTFLLSLFGVLTVLTKDTQSSNPPKLNCDEQVRSLLQHNSPEYLLIPDHSDLNTFMTTQIKVSVNWAHIHALIPRSCVRSYLLEYGVSDESKKVRSKRESVSANAQISPLLPPTTTSFTLSLKDDCQVYSVRLAVLVMPPANDPAAKTAMSYSESREFWPAAHRTTVEKFSEAIVLTWPPLCSHMTRNWRLRTCRKPSIVRKDPGQCETTSLQGESPLHISQLRTCALFTIDLLSSKNEDEVLWSFDELKTLPKPDFDVLAGHDHLNLRINQNECSPDTKVRFWRITHCDHTPVQQNAEKEKIVTSSETYEDDDDDEYFDEYHSGESSGDGDGEEGEYYTYDAALVQSPESCVNSLHDVIKLNEENKPIKLDNLKECTLYSIDITPTNDLGETLQPGEQYGTIHSTLCTNFKEDEQGIWFADNSPSKNATGLDPEISAIDHGREDSVAFYVLIVTGSIVVAVAIIGALWLRSQYVTKTQDSAKMMMGAAAAKLNCNKLPRSRSTLVEKPEEEVNSPKMALLNQK